MSSSLRILHTSDWHIGKKLYGIERYQEHQHFFNWLLKTINQQNIDIVIVAGDIYDVPSPPHKAVKLFFQFIKSFLDQTQAKLVIIGGNHDGPVFLESPNPILDSDRIFIKASMDDDYNQHCLGFEINNVQVNLFLLPYFRNYEIEKWFEKQSEHKDEEQAILDQLGKVFEEIHQADAKNILIAHHLFGQFEPSDSEYNIQLSGVHSIPTFLLKKYFDYVALGHIHKYQKIGSTPPSYYTGSPIAFRFSETTEKKINIIEFTKDDLNIESQVIDQLIELKTLKCHISELDKELSELITNSKNANKKIYLEAQIKVDGPIINLAQTIHEQLDQSNIELLSLLPIFKNQKRSQEEESTNVHQKSLTDHFTDYYKQVYGTEDIDETVLIEFNNLLNEVKTVKGDQS